MSSFNIAISKSFKECLETDLNTILMVGGRVGGKTKFTSIFAILKVLSENFIDGIILRANYGSLRTSSYAELESEIDELPSEIQNQFKLSKSPLMISKNNGVNNIYFMGYGGSNLSRTKGFKTSHKIGFVILEETQELKSKENLDEALASLRRNFGKNVKVFILGNPPPFKAHWFNQYVEQCKNDKSILVKHCSYLDIINFLNDYDLKEILKDKKLNEEHYRWFYLGESVGGFGSIYPMWQPEKFVITPEDFNALLFSGLKIVCVVIGVDGAVSHDSTAFVPIAILNNGQSVILDIFYHNPLENAVIGSHILVETYVKKWFNELVKKYNLGSNAEKKNDYYGIVKMIPIYMRCDSASTDLVQECRFFFGDRCDVSSISKGSIVEMVSSVQSAISNNSIYVINFGGYFNYYQNRFIKTEMNILDRQLQLMIWNEEQTQYDNSVPNDVCDAFTYGVRFWYGNIENKTYFDIVASNRENLSSIASILKKE